MSSSSKSTSTLIALCDPTSTMHTRSTQPYIKTKHIRSSLTNQTPSITHKTHHSTSTNNKMTWYETRKEPNGSKSLVRHKGKKPDDIPTLGGISSKNSKSKHVATNSPRDLPVGVEFQRYDRNRTSNELDTQRDFPSRMESGRYDRNATSDSPRNFASGMQPNRYGTSGRSMHSTTESQKDNPAGMESDRFFVLEHGRTGAHGGSQYAESLRSARSAGDAYRGQEGRGHRYSESVYSTRSGATSEMRSSMGSARHGEEAEGHFLLPVRYDPAGSRYSKTSDRTLWPEG
jgi:hypothetical protein